MIKQPIYINDVSLLSALVENDFSSHTSFFQYSEHGIVSKVSEQAQNLLNQLQKEDRLYAQLDRSVLMAILASRSLEIGKGRTGVNVGSSRGATGVWEDSFSHFSESGITTTQTSPLTTLGNISTWIAQDLGIDAIAFSHSITCATASHAFINAIAWLQSDMVDQFIVGGAEAPLTPFTIAQMKALRIYAKQESSYPCRALDLEKKQNTMVLGEAAACFLLSKGITQNTFAKIIGYGTAIEKLSSATSVSTEGKCLQDAMKMALKNKPLEKVDVIITHSPGTIKGDNAEFNAIKNVFGNRYPALCNNKWQIGHTLGASSAISIAMAIQMFKNDKIYTIPYLKDTFCNPRGITSPKRILVNATGFGGNAVCLLLEKE